MLKKLISLIFIAVAFASSAMEMPTPAQSYLDPLVKELKGLIVQHLTKAKSIDEAVKNIRSLRRVNKKFYNLINDPKLTEWIIYELAKKYAPEIVKIEKGPPGDERPVLKQNARLVLSAAALNTTASIQWLQNYLKDPKNMEVAEYLLVQMATKNVNIVDGLLKAGVNPNARSKYYGFAAAGATALEAAALSNYLPGVKRLLAAKANPNLRGADDIPLAMAIITNPHQDIIQALLDAGSNIPTDALHLAARRLDDQVAIPTITLLLNAGAPINQVYRGRTALDEAIEFGKMPKIIEFLKSRGAKKSI